jgi:AraC-like DNA-binding protein
MSIFFNLAVKLISFVTLTIKSFMVESLILTTLILSFLIALVCVSSNLVPIKRYLLTSFFSCITIQSFIKYLGFTNPAFVQAYPSLLILPELTSVLIPQIIYLYVLTLVNKPVKQSLLTKLLILPLVSVVFFYTFYFITDAFTTGNKFYLFEAYIGLLSLTFIANILFFIVSLREISNTFAHKLNELSKHNHISLIWIKWLLWLLLIRAVFSITFFTLQFLFNEAEWFPIAMLVQKTAVAIIMLVATSMTAYYGLRNPTLFDTISESPNVEQAFAISILTPDVKKVIKKTIKEEDVEPYLNQINTIVEHEKLYLNPGLTPSILSQKVGIPVYKLTLALNKGAGKNFNEYINYYRVNHAKNILSNSENNKSTIYAVALDSGFSSEAPFYAAFKKYVGKSPSAFRNSIEEKQ